MSPDRTPSPHPFFAVALEHRLPSLHLKACFQLTHPWTVLFGPSGSGKTTILRAIAGFLRPEFGHITLEIDEERATLLHTGRRVFVPPHLRPVRSATQSARLFPNMTVRENIAYGVRTGPASEALIDDVLRRFHIESLADRSPGELSGGETQRATTVRAAVSASQIPGSLLLLDEPFSGLDLSLTDQLLLDLRAWLAETRTRVLSVTHEIQVAFRLDAEVIRIDDGHVLDQGPPQRVLATERARILDSLDIRIQPPS